MVSLYEPVSQSVVIASDDQLALNPRLKNVFWSDFEEVSGGL